MRQGQTRLSSSSTPNEFRLAVFSDIHGNAEALEAVLTDLERRGGADILVAAGDLLTEGPFPQQTYDRLREAGVLLLLGNHDEYLLGYGLENLVAHDWQLPAKIQASNGWTQEQLAPAALVFLAEQPHQLRFGPEGLRSNRKGSPDELLVTHATPRSCHDHVLSPQADYQNDPTYRECYGSETAPLIVFGHFHHSYILTMPDGRRLVNVASVSMPFDKSRLTSYSLFHWNANSQQWQVEQYRVRYRWEVTARALHQCTMPQKDFMLSYFS